ncbi:MAG: hypothetical protein HYT40_03950 [Candidatus Sungbacteria bacterium]|uniref:Uncharacterized protein n=1 Tax=Candidatus Sungiibacteriota bacterium TaxID=2750080 RepID=A0A931SE20_9BACT|nr:hypothetical protein [Candidatus Sungbacteria bacterium]
MPELPARNAAEHIDEAELLRRFEEKKRLFEKAGGRVEAKEIFRGVFRDQAKELAPSSPPSPSLAASPATSAGSRALPGNDQALNDLIGIALARGILPAVRKAEAETPYLIDALHDELADHYYEKLVAAGKLRPQ